MNRSIVLLKSELARLGGLEKYTRQIAEALSNEGVQVKILTTGREPLFLPGIEVVHFPIDHPFSFSNVQHFDRACADYLASHAEPLIFGLDRNRFQTHLRAGNGSHASYLRARAEEEGWIKSFSFRCNPLHRLLLHIEKESFEHPELQLLFTNSHMVREEILSEYRVDPAKVKVVHNGVEWTAMQPDFDAWELIRPSFAQTLQLDLNCHQLLFIGHNFQRKGLDKLLDALARLPEKQVQLSVIGNDKNLPFYKKRVHDLGLSKQVRFFGPQKEIRPFYQIADTLVIPSHYDPFANVTVEALAMGVFVVSSARNGGSEVLSPFSGTVIPSLHDADAFVEALQTALRHPKTPDRARAIRASVSHLDFPLALRQIIGPLLSCG